MSQWAIPKMHRYWIQGQKCKVRDPIVLPGFRAPACLPERGSVVSGWPLGIGIGRSGLLGGVTFVTVVTDDKDGQRGPLLDEARQVRILGHEDADWFNFV